MKEEWKYFLSGALLVAVVMFLQMPKNPIEDCVAVAKYIEDPSSVKLTAHEKRIVPFIQENYRRSKRPPRDSVQPPMTYFEALFRCRRLNNRSNY